MFLVTDGVFRAEIEYSSHADQDCLLMHWVQLINNYDNDCVRYANPCVQRVRK